ncbi:MAG TPA: phage tail protein [Blastocatellia bacterium]|nr:phage tail protein [Blastocatellia bacterium]
MSSDPNAPGELMKYLPSIFHEDKLLADYLSAFEKILLGPGDSHLLSLEAIIAGSSRYFSPKDAPEDFLPWLAGWVAFGLRADMDVGLQREFLARIISLYKKRGTPDGLKELLRIFTGAEPTILEGDALARTDKAEWDVVGGLQKWTKDDKPEHAFGVLLSFMKSSQQTPSSTEIERKIAIAFALIDQEKPAHTQFYLIPVFPSMQLPKFSAKGRGKETDSDARSTIGVNTLLGVRPKPQQVVRKKGAPNAKRKAE